MSTLLSGTPFAGNVVLGNAISSDDDARSLNVGFVYILTNDTLNADVLKIGHTTKNPIDRASEVSGATGVAQPFKVLYWELVPDARRAELIVHERLEAARVSKNREFFRVAMADAIRVVHEVAESERGRSSLCTKCDVRTSLAAALRTCAEFQAAVAEMRASVATSTRESAEKLARANAQSRRLQRIRARLHRRQRHRTMSTCREVARAIRTAGLRFGYACFGLFVRCLPDTFDRRLALWLLFVPCVLTASITVTALWPVAAVAFGLLFVILLMIATFLVAGPPPRKPPC